MEPEKWSGLLDSKIFPNGQYGGIVGISEPHAGKNDFVSTYARINVV